MIIETFSYLTPKLQELSPLLPLFSMAFTIPVRKEILLRMGYKCDICGQVEIRSRSKTRGFDRLQMHHKVAECNGGSNKAENGVPLCGAFCHVICDLLTIVYELDYETAKFVIQSVILAKNYNFPDPILLGKEQKKQLTQAIEEVARQNGFSKKPIK